MIRLLVVLAASLASVTALVSVAVADDRGETIAIKTARVDVGDGTSIDNAVVLIVDGAIQAVGANVTIPEGARVIEAAGGVVTPGLIDANATITREKIGVARTGHPARIRMTRFGAALIGEAPTQAARISTATTANTPIRAATVREQSGKTENALSFSVKKGLSIPRGLRMRADDLDPDHNHDQDEGTRVCNCGLHEPPDATGSAEGTIAQESVSEGVSEVVPFTRVIDSIDLMAPDFARLARHGVTTVFVSPDGGSVIGARGAIVKTGGPTGGRIVSPVDAVKAALGRDPISRGGRSRWPNPYFVSFRTRRPNTRMGVTWVFRKAFYEAQAAMANLPPIGGADTPPDEAIEPLIGLLQGEIPLRIHARTQIDILTAIRLTDEFGLRFTLEEGIDAYRCVDALKTRDVPVIYGPIFVEPVGWRARANENFKPKLATAKTLVDAGIRMALTAHEMRDEEGLAAQAAFAMRFGLTYQQALAAVTSIPARILGIDSATGTIGPDKNADLVLWSGQPFDSATRIEAVLINGEIVYERK